LTAGRREASASGRLRAARRRLTPAPQAGSSSLPTETAMDALAPADMNPQTAQQLKSIVERIERLEEEKKALAEDIKEVYAEAKGNGFDVKIIRKVVSLRKQETAERVEQEQLIDLYLAAVGTKN